MPVFFKRRGEPTSMGKRLSEYVEGDLVLIHENGTPVEFYVAKHDYESALNGAGRTLLVRKDCYNQRQWHSSLVNAYASSSIDDWLNRTYKAMLSDKVKNAMGETKFRYTVGNGSTTVTTLTRSLFILSMTELGKSEGNANVEGSALPIANTLKVARKNGTAVAHWTRTPAKNSTGNVFCIVSSGDITNISCTASYYSRPCFTLPAKTRFDPNTNVIK